MPMTVVVTRDVASRIRGFLASCMLEIAPGVYTSPKLSKAVRERIWSVCNEWFEELVGTAIVMTWEDPREAGGQGVRLLGVPPKELIKYQGLSLTRRDLPKGEMMNQGKEQA